MVPVVHACMLSLHNLPSDTVNKSTAGHKRATAREESRNSLTQPLFIRIFAAAAFQLCAAHVNVGGCIGTYVRKTTVLKHMEGECLPAHRCHIPPSL